MLLKVNLQAVVIYFELQVVVVIIIILLCSFILIFGGIHILHT